MKKSTCSKPINLTDPSKSRLFEYRILHSDSKLLSSGIVLAENKHQAKKHIERVYGEGYDCVHKSLELSCQLIANKSTSRYQPITCTELILDDNRIRVKY